MQSGTTAVNNILRSEITKLDHTLLPPGFTGGIHIRNVQECLATIIDHLGKLSAEAQGLHKVITTSSKMRTTPGYVLYLLKDAESNQGAGEVIGLLKVGHKHLYLADSTGRTIETDPLCVLDFYVHQSRQRRGLGKKLFDNMLQDMNVAPHQLAVDGPSPAMLHFLAKTYGMHDMIRHANNFAVAPDFFQTIAASKSNCVTPASTSSGAGRFTAPKPGSNISGIIHGDNFQNVNDLSHTRFNRIY